MADQGIFVKIERHEEIQQIMKNIRQKAFDAKEKMQKIRALDAQEKEKMSEFDEAIDHVNANLDQIGGYLRQ